MSLGAILLLAVGLAMDAAAVSAARGLATRSGGLGTTAPELRAGHVVRVAVFFGGFQALMPLLGWALGSWIGPSVQAWSGWIAFVILAAIGGKMLWEARGDHDAEPRSEHQLFGTRVMLVLAIATSIDAFAVGVTLPMLHAPLALSVAAIGVVTAALSALGLIVGRRASAALGNRLDAVGGLVLIGLAIKILVEHLRNG